MSNEIERPLTEIEFCKAVGISRTTAYRLRGKGMLPHCKIGTRVLYRVKHVAEFLAKHERN